MGEFKAASESQGICFSSDAQYESAKDVVFEAKTTKASCCLIRSLTNQKLAETPDKLRAAIQSELRALREGGGGGESRLPNGLRRLVDLVLQSRLDGKKSDKAQPSAD